MQNNVIRVSSEHGRMLSGTAKPSFVLLDKTAELTK